MRVWSAKVPSDSQLDEIAALLRGRGVILLPTDTIYGLHALAGDVAAVERVCDIKGREDTKPFVVIASSLAQLSELPIEISQADRETLASIWPAPLTAILPLRVAIAASRGAPSLALRVPALDWLRDLAARTGPLISTSANRSGEPPVASPAQLPRGIVAEIDGIVDAGPLAGEPSTIVDFTGREAKIVREGNREFSQKVWKTLRKSL